MIAKIGLNVKTYSLGSGVGMRFEEFIKRLIEISTSNIRFPEMRLPNMLMAFLV